MSEIVHKQNGFGKKKKTKRIKHIKLKKFFYFTLSFIIIISLIGFGVIATWMIDTPGIDSANFNSASSSTVYDINGNVYQQLQAVQNRTAVSIDRVPEIIQLAFISIEDQRFYSHHGVDLRGTMKAIFDTITSGSTNGRGGSTITQQLIKQTMLTSKVSIKRKVKEWKLAVELESKMPKRQILEEYLNQVNMSLTWGIQNAAQEYFGKDVSELTLAQAAVLASIINAPTYYNPYDYETDENGNIYIKTFTGADGNTVIAYSEANKSRALLVIQKMFQLGHINEQEYNIAKNELENNLIDLKLPNASEAYTYFTDAVYTQVLNDIKEQYHFSDDVAENMLLNGGLKIYSTVDPIIQNALEQQADDDNNFPEQSWSAETVSAALSESTGRTVNYIPQLGGVVIQNKTGYVSGIIGGREKTGSLTINRALRKFQIGSTTKPLTVYAPGINENIFTLRTMFNNRPLTIGDWTVFNTPNTYTGMTTVRDALKYSINIVAVLAQEKVGIETSAYYGEKFGLDIVRSGYYNDMNPAALALGGYTYGQTPLAVASAYTVFPNGGYRNTPTFYTKVEDSKGNIILSAQQERTDVVTPETAYQITLALQDVVRGGTTYRSVSGQQIGGKTGTTDNEACTWFTGFTSEYTASFWWGYDENYVTVGDRHYNLYIGMGGGGTDSPAQYWEKVFRQFYKEKNLPDAQLPPQPDKSRANTGTTDNIN